MLAVAAFVFTYYTFWALLTPFLSPTSPLLALFPPREYAVAFPAILVLVGGSGVAAFIGRVMMKEARKRRIREGKAA
ncbi:hypothetical protein FFLO_00276 [Filobasidium floriforme]|uniref:Dolichol phosphate-mannose biosynthesis regulatory protein n=2 Tax=Filobasidium floriforme TaxID=5210 RepID=A0A8K0JWK5_9TREE|nr:hypothetical protein FFLO_00276 [Filobasidium floriforme]